MAQSQSVPPHPQAVVTTQKEPGDKGATEIKTMKIKPRNDSDGASSSFGRKKGKKKHQCAGTETGDTSEGSDESLACVGPQVKRTIDKTQGDSQSLKRISLRPIDADSLIAVGDLLQRCANREGLGSEIDRKPMGENLLAATGIDVGGVRNKSSQRKFIQNPHPRGQKYQSRMRAMWKLDKCPTPNGEKWRTRYQAISEGFGIRDDARDVETKECWWILSIY